jgi:hypothetical protein
MGEYRHLEERWFSGLGVDRTVLSEQVVDAAKCIRSSLGWYRSGKMTSELTVGDRFDSGKAVFCRVDVAFPLTCSSA